MNPPEKIAVAVLWHGPELIFQERQEDNRFVYAFPGGKIEPREKPIYSLIREMNEEVGLIFQPEDFGKQIVMRLSRLIGYFHESRLPMGIELKPQPSEPHQTLVKWSPDKVQAALEEDIILPLSREYIGKYL